MIKLKEKKLYIEIVSFFNQLHLFGFYLKVIIVKLFAAGQNSFCKSKRRNKNRRIGKITSFTISCTTVT